MFLRSVEAPSTANRRCCGGGGRAVNTDPSVWGAGTTARYTPGRLAEPQRYTNKAEQDGVVAYGKECVIIGKLPFYASKHD
jgi:hypothetical protein